MKLRSLLLLLLAALPLAAQEPIKWGNTTFSGSVRFRLESWDWFNPGTGNDHHYTFLGTLIRFGLSESTANYDWQLEMAAPILLGLPSTAVAAGAAGQLGMGASYYVANTAKTNSAMAFAKQGFFRWKKIGGLDGQTLRFGRFEFNDGTEATPKDATLAALKRDRISQRLLGNFGFSDVGRAVDGFHYSLTNGNTNITILGARPTRGVFQTDGWGDLKINVFYGAVTRQIPEGKSASEVRAFAVGYYDMRNNVVKTDNRPLAARKADTGHIEIGTYGGHFLQTLATRAGTLDGLFWGALQNGTWGSQVQRAWAWAGEAGWQPPGMADAKPWFRAGRNQTSGDANPNDTTHATFFQVLPTPRVYARFPFFNMMNMTDTFGEIVLRPKKLTIRADIHNLRLTSASDLWYSGGGAFQPWTFGYTGRASGGHADLANLWDVSADYAVNSHTTATFYTGFARGGTVMKTIYPTNSNANLTYVEVTYRF